MADDDALAGIALRAAVSCREAAIRHRGDKKAGAFRRAAELWDAEAKYLRARANPGELKRG